MRHMHSCEASCWRTATPAQIASPESRLLLIGVVATRRAVNKQRAAARILGEGASETFSAVLAEEFKVDKFVELKRQFEALGGRCEGLAGALAAETVAREDVEQLLAKTEAKAVTLAEAVTDPRSSQQRFEISTRRASLVVHKSRSLQALMQEMQSSRSAPVQAFSRSHTARR